MSSEGDNKILGQRGEDKAAEYLKKNGYCILECNFKLKRGELDIVAKKNGKLVIVEVKTLRQKLGFHPLDQVNWRKQRQLIKIAQLYLIAKKLPLDTVYQIDIVAVQFDYQDQLVRLEHFPNAISSR